MSEKILQLEKLYAERLANGADDKELRVIWKKIQDSKTVLLLTETYESISKSPQPITG